MLVSLNQCQVSKVTVMSQKQTGMCFNACACVGDSGDVLIAIPGHYDAARLFAQSLCSVA